MISMKIREIIIADRKDGMTVNAISLAVRVSESAIYRLFQKKHKTGSIEPTYYNCGKKPEVTAEKLIEMESLVIENSDITLEEISNILRKKLGFRSHDHHFKWWFEVSPIRAEYLRA